MDPICIKKVIMQNPWNPWNPWLLLKVPKQLPYVLWSREAMVGRVVCGTLRGMRSPHPCFTENRALLRLKLSVPHISR